MHIKYGLGLKLRYQQFRLIGKQKIFCIGLNKTGTTSLRKEMKDLGYSVGNQRQAELLFDDWVKRDFRRIIKYCHTAQFFQDFPFSLPFTFIALDQAFPGSKFILTLRDNAELWYDSLIRFHGKKWASGRTPPTSEDLQSAEYIYKGFPFHAMMHIYNLPENDPYNKDALIEYYETHKKNVLHYFRYRPNDLVTIRIKEDVDYIRFCKFLGIIQRNDSFPWEKKT